jgi:hypothetical protein
MMTRIHTIFEAAARALLLAAALACFAALAFFTTAASAAEESKVGGAFGDKDKAVAADPIPPEALLPATAGACPALLDYRVEDIRGRTVNLCAFSGKVLLIVNVASR